MSVHCHSNSAKPGSNSKGLPRQAAQRNDAAGKLLVSKKFKDMCEMVEVKPTVRQAKKYLAGVGILRKQFG